MSKILVTGAAGFIGFHLCRRLVQEGAEVVGVDNLCEYYDVRLKRDRLAELEDEPNFTFERIDLADRGPTAELFQTHTFGRVIHLAAQAGVRYSLDNPAAYVDSNLVGFLNVLEGCRHARVEHLLYASSSSVYGANSTIPFRVQHNVDHPVSLYAATKKANELMAHSYSWLYGLPTTGLRLFTVYGPWGRPDMAVYKFADAIVAGRPIDVYNHGDMRRDFTYIDDVIEAVVRLADCIPAPDPDWSSDRPNPASSSVPYRLYNIGNSRAEPLRRMIEVLEQCLDRQAEINLLPMQPGDVAETWADSEALARQVGFRPDTPLEEGLAEFVRWYRAYHGVAEAAA